MRPIGLRGRQTRIYLLQDWFHSIVYQTILFLFVQSGSGGGGVGK